MSATLERVNSYRYLRIYRVKTEIHGKVLHGVCYCENTEFVCLLDDAEV